MKRKHICFVLALLMAPAAIAQNVNAVVEVSRTYESSLLLTPKPVLAMAVPDSLLRFDLDFDYSVFDKPYQGTGVYRPYLLDFRPQPDAYRGKNLYLRAGLGYSLHPELDMVYSPEVGKNSSINIYALHRSYFGKYKYRASDLKDAPQDLYVRDTEYTGYDSYSKLGVNGTVGLPFGQFYYDAHFKGIQVKDGSFTSLVGGDAITSSFTNLNATAGLRGKLTGGDIYYKGEFNFGLGAEDINVYSDKIGFTNFGFAGKVGKNLTDGTVEVDVRLRHNSYSGLGKSTLGDWEVNPKYLSANGDLKFKLGLKLSSIIKSADTWIGKPYDPDKGQFVYPDFSVTYSLLPGELDLFASLTGGNDFASYQTVKERSHPDRPQSAENVVEHFNLQAGLRGNVNSSFRYEVAGGFHKVSNYAFFEFIAPNSHRVGYYDASEGFLKANVVYDAKPLLIEARLLFRGTSADLDNLDVNTAVFKPRNLMADIKALYYWKSRLCGGVTASVASSSKFKGNNCQGYMPGYVDLGLYGEYSVDRTLSVYGRISNLLNSRIIDFNLVPRSGMYATFGIILNI